MDIVALMMPWIALRLEQARSRQMGLATGPEGSGWAEPWQRIEDKSGEPKQPVHPPEPMRSAVFDAETGEELVRAIVQADLRLLCQAPGVGKRTAATNAATTMDRVQASRWTYEPGRSNVEGPILETHQPDIAVAANGHVEPAIAIGRDRPVLGAVVGAREEAAGADAGARLDATVCFRHRLQAAMDQPRGNQHELGLHRGGLPAATKLHRPGARISGPQLGRHLGHQGGTGGNGCLHQPLIESHPRENPPGR
jgi:hypothetical protein